MLASVSACILLGSLLCGIMALAKGCGVDCTWQEERAVVSAVAYAVDKKDNQRCAGEQGKLKWRLGNVGLAP